MFAKALKSLVFARGDEPFDQAAEAVGVVFQNLVAPNFQETRWARRVGFSDGQSLCVSIIEDVDVEDFLETITGFAEAFQGLGLHEGGGISSKKKKRRGKAESRDEL